MPTFWFAKFVIARVLTSQFYQALFRVGLDPIIMWIQVSRLISSDNTNHGEVSFKYVWFPAKNIERSGGSSDSDGWTFRKSGVPGKFCGFKFFWDKLCCCCCKWQYDQFLRKQCTTDRFVRCFRACKAIWIQASNCVQCQKLWCQCQR